ncbi:MAG: Gfo/Idh/MocA family oxidoreductase [Gammaproteobacteria bacterium]|nr:Gfo/Idh/MocA family oxidoreductase [Gammaproteobacteria bacterium]NIP89472.1 Gfo/Idh/MocA family oxidoreductase [Gammaproteobacteria bacterium]NIR24306.1 Gfo/Idh/MocA family oxidoreductase [Gammaproteobacteria bacterium]NIS05975.1 Gfo/Idh/MocA family oxidoreductase [Gammaproteobacteria bacterium]NIU41213.1 Gfo/Idh/MocA family oxidoreductase [Gammaproteobacteria bacterium]
MHEQPTDRLRTAVIGVGYLGKFHAQKLAEIPGSELVAVVDVDEGARESLASDLGVDAVGDYRKLIGAVDAVSVVVPTPAHFEIAEAFLDSGTHVLVEKPITETVEQATRLIDTASRRGTVLQVGHLERFNPAVRALKPLLDNPRFVESVRIAPYQERGTDVDVVLDLMIHDIDLVQYIAGSPIERLEAVGAAVITDKPDVANARIRFESGCIANVTASRTSLKVERKIRIFQHSCYFSADLHQKAVAVYRKGESTIGALKLPIAIEQLECDDGDALRLEIESFLQAIRDGTPALVSGEDGRQALETAIDIIAQVQTWTASH